MRLAWALPLLAALLVPALGAGGWAEAREVPGGAKLVAEDLGPVLERTGGGYSAVWLAGAVYVFGGHAQDVGPGGTDEILRIDARTGAVETLEARLPTRAQEPAVATDGRHAYVFGTHALVDHPDGEGSMSPPGVRAIYRFDPSDGHVATMGATLPYEPRFGSAVWDGERFLVFGGCQDGPETCPVVTYDPATDTAAAEPVAGATGVLPAFLLGHAVVVDGENYLFPESHDDVPHLVVQGYATAERAATAMPSPLAMARRDFAAVAHGSRVLLVGGNTAPHHGGSLASDLAVLVYDVSDHSSYLSCVSLPERAYRPAAVLTPHGVVVVGASPANGSRHVHRFDPALLDTCEGPGPTPEPVGRDPPWATIPEASPGPLPARLKANAPAGAEATVFNQGASVQYKCGDAPCPLDIRLHASLDPDGLPAPVPRLPEATLYIEVVDTSPGVESVLVEMPVPRGADGDWAIHYFDGKRWVDLSDAGRTVAGATPAQDLQVFATGHDPARGVAWARVDHTSTYAVAPATALEPRPPATPWHAQPALQLGVGVAVAAVLAAELVALAVVARRRA